MFFDAQKSKPTNPIVRPLEDQGERESQRLWQKVAQAVKDRDHDLATDEKSLIEERQREEAAKRAADGLEWTPRLFRRVKGGPGGSEEGEEDLEWIISGSMYASPVPCMPCCRPLELSALNTTFPCWVDDSAEPVTNRKLETKRRTPRLSRSRSRRFTRS